MKRSRKQLQPSTAVDLMALAEIVERFTGKHVVVLGDFVADEFQFGDITRVSREAPVLILKHRASQIVPGGGANAVNNFSSLGAKVTPVTAVGDDVAGRRLLEIFKEKRVDTSAILRVKGWITPTKTRFLAGWAHTVGQQVLRVDYEPVGPPPEAARMWLRRKLATEMTRADAMAISDYGFGIATPEEVRRATRGQRREIPVTLDSRYRLADYKKAGITAATPNEAELETLHQTVIGKNVAELERCGEATREELKLHSLLVTRGRDGMALYQAQHKVVHIAVYGSDQAVDVTGAGDTVLAAYTLALASGASPIEAAHIANIAGGLVVMKRGTATVLQQELLDAIRTSASGASA